MRQSFLLQHALDKGQVQLSTPPPRTSPPLTTPSLTSSHHALLCCCCQVPKHSFSTLLSYIQPLQGLARQVPPLPPCPACLVAGGSGGLLSLCSSPCPLSPCQRLLLHAKEVIASYAPPPAGVLDEGEAGDELKAAKRRYQRAKRLLQVLS